MNEHGTVLIRLPEVRRRVPVGKSTIYEWIKRGIFPRPLNLGGNIVAWREADIDQWIAERS